MAKKSKLTKAAVRIGTAVGRADRRARKLAKAVQVARKEVADLSSQVEKLARDVKKASKRVRRAMR